MNILGMLISSFISFWVKHVVIGLKKGLQALDEPIDEHEEIFRK